MERRIEALLLLNGTQNFDARKIRQFEEDGFSPEELVFSGPLFWEEKKFSPGSCFFLREALEKGWAAREGEECGRRDITIITCEDSLYPPALWDLPEPPLALYCQGETSFPSDLVGIVGTRRCSSYGAGAARSLGRALAEAGFGVLSGGALGIDGAAHAGALESSGYTAAVFGTGIDRPFPEAHDALFRNILKARGALISEFPLGTPGKAWRFPRRNRIIAALVSKVVVVEAPQRSGAIITARIGAEIGREIWAVPGRITEKLCAGSNGLFREGAFPLLSPEEFVESFATPLPEQGLLFPPDSFDPSPPSSPPGFSQEELQETQKKILASLRLQGEQTVDNVARGVTMSAASVLGELVLLETRGYVYQSGPGRWSANL